MLDNLVGPEDTPSQVLIEDFRTLCGLSSDALRHMGKAFEALRDDFTTGAALRDTVAALRSFEAEPQVEPSARVALFMCHQWASRALTREQIVNDIRSLGTTEEQLANFTPLLDAMENKLGAFQRREEEEHVLGVGTPHIEFANCVFDARAVFAGRRYDKDLDESQPYFQFDRFIPIVVLEIVAELNDEATTHAFLLTEAKLEQLYDILKRARTRMTVLKNSLLSDSSNR